MRRSGFRVVRLLAVMPFILLSALSVNVSADIGTDWLSAQSQSDGSYTGYQRIATTFQSTSETLRVFHDMGLTNQTGQIAAQDYLNTEPFNNTEYLSRKIIAGLSAGNDVATLIAVLKAYQNADGGFGELPGYSSTSLDTAYALEALAIAGRTGDPDLSHAIAYLVSQQSSEGGFALNTANDSAIFVTAVASIALQKYRIIYNLSAAIDSATNHLLQQRDTTGAWSTHWETAAALLAVMPTSSDAAVYADAITALQGAQLSDGSWKGDTFITALALRALYLSQNIILPTTPTVGVVTGQVVERGSSQPLAGATVVLDQAAGIETATGADGRFTFNDVTPGDYNLSYTIEGYNSATQNTSIVAGQTLDLGQIGLTTLPDVGVISGAVTDAATGEPIDSAEVAITLLSNTTTVSTDSQGLFHHVSAPGNISVSVMASGYDAASGSATLMAGSHLNFSPALHATGTTPVETTITVVGQVFDGDSLFALNGATVSVTGGTGSVLTGVDGTFQLIVDETTSLQIEIAQTGYQTVGYSALVSPGVTVDLGDVYLQKLEVPQSTTLIGRVSDTDTGEAVSGATVTVEGYSVGAISGLDGYYRIENISTKDFSLSTTAVGYLTTSGAVNLVAHGTAEVNVQMQRAIVSNLELTDVHSHSGNLLDAMTGAEIDAVMLNSGAEPIKARLYIKVVNEAGEVVEHIPEITIPMGGGLEDALVQVDPGQTLERELHWFTGRNLPGTYQVIVQAYDGVTGQLLDERGTSITVKATTRIGGSVMFDPPITQLAANKPVSITATVSNNGNLNIDGTMLVATVTLKNEGYKPRTDLVEVTTLAVNEVSKSLRGMDMGPDGNIYAADYDNYAVKVITPSGEVSTLLEGLPERPLDVDFDADGNLYILLYRNHYVIHHVDGTVTEMNVGVPYPKAIEWLADGRVLIASGTRGVYQVDENGQVTQLAYSGLSRPHGVVVNSVGDVYIANTNKHSIEKFSANVLTTFVTGINNPKGMDIDALDNLYVVSTNSLFKITPQGDVSLITDALKNPYDVKVSPTGGYVVSNQILGQVVHVSDDGVVTALSETFMRSPSAIVHGAQGDLFIASQGTARVTRIDTQSRLQMTSGNMGSVTDMVLEPDGSISLLASAVRKIYRMDDTGVFAELASGLGYGAQGMVRDHDGGGFMVAETNFRKITQVDSTGQPSTYLTPYLDNMSSAITDPLGNRYALKDHHVNGYIEKITPEGVVSRLAEGLRYPRGLALDTAGNLYTAEYHNRRVMRIAPDDTVTVDSTLNFNPRSITVDSLGNLFVTDHYRVYTKNEDGTYSEKYRLPSSLYSEIIVDAQDQLWAAGYTGVYRYLSDGSMTAYPIRYGRSLSSDGTGGVYVGMTGGVKHIATDGSISDLITTMPTRTPVLDFNALDDGSYWAVLANEIIVYGPGLQQMYRFVGLKNPYDLFYTDTGDLLVLDANYILKTNGTGKLAEHVVDGPYREVLPLGGGEYLLATKSKIDRFDVATKSLSLFATGFAGISSMSLSNSIVTIAEQSSNQLIELDLNGTRLDAYTSLNSPKGLLYDGEGKLLVANAAPSNITALWPDGRTKPFSNLSAARYMILESDGTIRVSKSTTVIHLSAAGDQIGSMTSPTPYGLFRDGTGDLLVTGHSSDGLYAHQSDGSYRKLISGIGDVRDIEQDDTGQIYIADSNRGDINLLLGDDNLTLLYDGLPAVNKLDITSDMMYAAYGRDKIAYFDENAVRNELDVAPSFLVSYAGANGMVADSQNNHLYVVNDLVHGILDFEINPVDSTLNPGDVVFTAEFTLPALLPGSEALSIDFGSFLPQVSGDYLVTVEPNETSIDGSLINSLHVGPLANGRLSLAKSMVFPGDQSVNATLQVFGADNTAVSTIDPDGATLAAQTYVNGRGVTADTQGNLYAADRTKIVKVTPDGQLSDFATNLGYLGNGLAADSRDNIYAVSGGNILRISSAGVVDVLTSLPGGAASVALDYQERIYAISGGGNTLYRVFEDGAYQAVTSTGLYRPYGLAIDGYGNFYIQNGRETINGVSINRLIKISPDGKTSATYYDKAKFEYEGVNITADCSNNLLFAPIYIPEFKAGGEEDKIIQLVGDTGEVREVFNGAPVDYALRDMDVLSYDRFGKRLLIWSDYSAGKVFSFPLYCGGIDANAHLVTRTDVDMTGFDLTPDNIIDRHDGTFEYVWRLTDVDNRGQTVELNTLFKTLQEGETRPVVAEAYLTFNNSFDPGADIRTSIDIPELLASTQMAITPSLDAEAYGVDSPVNISVDVINDNGVVFNGSLTFTIMDAGGSAVEILPVIEVTGLESFTNALYTAQWNTGTTISGGYSVEATLQDTDGRNVASGNVPFTIVEGSLGDPQLTSSVFTDKPVYQSWDSVDITGRLRNIAANAVQEATAVKIMVTEPNGTMIYTAESTLNTLFPNNIKDTEVILNLVDSDSGQYQVYLVATDTLTGEILSQSSTAFAVERAVEQGLQGTVDVSRVQIQPGDANNCTETVTNIGKANLTGTTFHHILASMDTAEVIVQTSEVVDIASGSSYTQVNSLITDSLTSGAYACVLQVEIDGVIHNLASAGFEVQEPPVRISGEMAKSSGGRILVLTDAPEQPAGSCTSLTQLTMSTVFDAPLAANSELVVNLYDQDAQLIDTEQVRLSDFITPHNLNVGLEGQDLRVTGFSDQSLALSLDGFSSLNGYLNEDYQITANLNDGANVIALDTGLIHTQCGEARVVGEHFGTFRIDSLQSLAVANDQHGPVDSPSEISQFSLIQRLLNEAGWQYTLVTDAEAFEEAFFQGGYSAYALFSEQVKLPETLQKAVREAAYRGEGLLVAGDHDQRNHTLYDALGVTYRGKEPKAYGVALIDSALLTATEIALQLNDKAIDTQLNGATTAGHFQVDGNNLEPVHAVTYHQYGEGRTVHVGYDLLAEATLSGLDSVHVQLIHNALVHVVPSSVTLQQGVSFPLTLTVTNEGIATLGRAVITLPVGVAVIDSAQAQPRLDGTLVWSFSLLEGDVQQLTLWLQSHTALTSLSIDALIQSGEHPDYLDQESLYLSLILQAKPALSAALDELTLLESQDKAYRKALQWLTQADTDQELPDYPAAIDALLKCADELIKLDTPEAADVRLKVAEAIRQIGLSL
ncbi:MAG: carboxypeptidase-like regulatory domain-containing protein [Candidatus Thiodiazotropha endolucinida]